LGDANHTRNKLLENSTNSLPSSFLAGREFRAYREFDLANGGAEVFKFVTPIDIYLDSIFVNITSGEVDFTSRAGGTEGGTFTLLPTVFPKNERSDVKPYVQQVVVTEGGTVSGGLIFDIAKVKTATSSQRVSVIEKVEGKRGLAAGTYYLSIDCISASNGVLYFNWTEA
tara:strand:- start:76 stop:585 length:510 start_codon:yes stop_codon:yes gene_type:complete